MATISGAIDSSQRELVIDTATTEQVGYQFWLDDEVLTLDGFGSTKLPGRPVFEDRTKLVVSRGQEGSAAAAHDDGSTLVAYSPRPRTRANMLSELVAGIPTADPHVAGQVWSNSGVLTISAGA